MKKLLLFTTALFITYTISAQAPANGNAENATLINLDGGNNYFSNSYSEAQIRLDLAENDAGGQVGCTITANPSIYYKFEANEDATIRATISDFNNQSLGFTNVIFYTAPNLNVTNNSDLQVASFCGQSSQESINVTQGQAYYVVFLRVNGGSNLTNVQFSKAPKNVDVQSAELIDNFNFTDYNWIDMATQDAGGQMLCPVTGFTTVYYKFTASESGTLNISQSMGPSDGFAIVFSASDLNATQNSDLTQVLACSFGNLTTYPITAGSSYYVICNNSVANTYTTIQFQFTPPAPNNDLVVNAYEATSFPYEDIVNINGATGPEAFSGTCNTGANPVVYYKFTASADMTLAATVFDAAEAGPSVTATLNSSGVVYIYTAADQNVTNESQLTQVGVCVADASLSGNVGGYSKTFEATQGTTYYVQVRGHNPNTPTASSKVRIEVATPLQTSERDALIDFYNSTTGNSWNFNDFWGSAEQVGSWFGVATHIVNGQEHVTAISFTGNNLDGTLPSSIGNNLSQLQVFSLQANFADSFLTGGIPDSFGNLSELTTLYIRYHDILGGNIPASLGNLTKLRVLYLEDNGLTGSIPQSLANLNNLTALFLIYNDLQGAVPDFSTSPNFGFLDIRLNYFNFSDIESNHAANLTLGTYWFSPQRTLDDEEEIISPPGANITLDVDDDNVNREAQDPSPNNVYQWYKDDVAISGANQNTYTITNAQVADDGVYYCDITNPLVADLIIRRANITVIVDENLSIANFDADGFALFPNPANDWITIKTKLLNNATLQLFNVSGQLLMSKPLTSEITSLATDQLASGMYLISITSDNINSTKRFIKQ